MIILVRELAKNLALYTPTRLLETVANYAVIGSSRSALVPPRLLRGVPKPTYFEAVREQLEADGSLLFLEFGVYRGTTMRIWSDLNTHPESHFVGFDSFVGLPEAWRNRPAGYFTTDGEIPEIDDDRVSFVKGFFNATLPAWLNSNRSMFGQHETVLVHVDSDLYSSAMYVLTQLQRELESYYVMFDDFGTGEARALRDYLSAYGAGFQPILGRCRKRYSRVPGQVFGVLRTGPLH